MPEMVDAPVDLPEDMMIPDANGTTDDQQAEPSTVHQLTTLLHGP